jgi:HK97 family phage major capsid protein
MAITDPTTLANFSGFVSREQSEWIFQKAAQNSLVQSLARRVPLAASGQSIPVVTGKPVAGWVAEGAQKPATQGTVTLKTMDPKKLAAIAVVSAEVVRANPANYISLLREELAEAFAVAFDSAAMHGTSSPFSTNLDTGSSTQEFTGTAPAFTATAVWGDLNAGLATLVAADKTPTGWALDRRLEPVLNTVVDSAGRPLFIESPLTETAGPVARGRLMSRPAVMGTGVYTAAADVYAYLGDWTQVAWGAVGDISYKVSTEAAVTIDGVLVSLFENNLVAILAEAEYGFLVNDPAAFVKYTNAA